MNLPDHLRAHWVQPKVGHYGVFNGSRFRAEIAPRIADFMANTQQAARQSSSTVVSLDEGRPARQ